MINVILPPVYVHNVVNQDDVGTIVTRVSLLIDTDHVYSDTIMTDSKKRTQHKVDCKYALFIF